MRCILTGSRLAGAMKPKKKGNLRAFSRVQNILVYFQSHDGLVSFSIQILHLFRGLFHLGNLFEQRQVICYVRCFIRRFCCKHSMDSINLGIDAICSFWILVEIIYFCE